MSDAVVWLVVGLVLVAAEVASGDFVLLFLGVGALAAAAAALGVDSILIEGAVAVAVAGLSVGLLRGPLKRRVTPPLLLSGTQALVGRSCVVVQRIDNDANTGQVRIGGEVWRARAYGDGPNFEEGDKVDVIAIEGVTALVL